jgi:hypothetical protein
VTGLGYEAEAEQERDDYWREAAFVECWWREIAAELLDLPARLTAWEQNFLGSLTSRQDISPKQVAVLMRISGDVEERPV